MYARHSAQVWKYSVDKVNVPNSKHKFQSKGKQNNRLCQYSDLDAVIEFKV